MRFPINCLLFALSLFVVISINTNASSDREWNEGVVVLDSREVIRGEVNLSQKFDVLRVKHEGKIKSFPAGKIRQVSILDEDLDALRRYISLDRSGENKSYQQFYEVVIQGHIQLLAREKQYKSSIEMKTTRFFNKLTPSQQQVVEDQDFFFYDGKTLIPMDKFRKRVLPAFEKYFESEIQTYIKEEKLNKNAPIDQVKITKYFNQLYNENLILAIGQ